MIPASVALPLIALATGWLALFPLRKAIGPVFYHIAAFPIGLLAWMVVAALTSAFGIPFGFAVGVAGHVVFVTSVAGLALVLAGRMREGLAVPWWSWPVWGAVFAVLTRHLARAGQTAVVFDSFTHYELSGIWLHDTGLLDTTIMSGRGPLIPAMHAANRLMSGEWTYVPYTLFAYTVLALLAVVFVETAFARLPRTPRVALSLGMVALLGMQPAWTSHSYLVHSNMMSAGYLLIAVAALLAGGGHIGQRRISARERVGWWFLAGLAAAGLATARPDGLAYVYALLALAFVVHARLPHGWRPLAGLYGSLYLVTALVYVPVFATIGIWTAHKLQGSWVLVLIGASALLAVATALLPEAGRLGDWLRVRNNAIRFAAAVNIAAILPLAWVTGERFHVATANVIGNLMRTGGWGSLWYAILGVILLSLVFRREAAFGQREDLILYALLQFFAIGLVIHGLTHPGRLNWMDSFNRVSLHVLPIAWWYVSSFLGALLARPTGGDEAQGVRVIDCTA